MPKITIRNAENRPVENLRLGAAFVLNGTRYYDFEDLGAFSGNLQCTLTARGGHDEKGEQRGLFLSLKSRSEGDGVITIELDDDRVLTNVRLFAEFTINGAKHSDFEDIGNFDSDKDLKLNAWAGRVDGDRWVGNFLRATGAATGRGILIEYAGAHAENTGRPDVAALPSDPNVDVYIALSFAQDLRRDGNFELDEDLKGNDITPDLVQRWKSDGNRRFLISLAGDDWLWQTPSDRNGWVANAVRSLGNLMDQFHLDGVDLNYEDGIEGGLNADFASIMGEVVAQLKKNKGAFISLGAYVGTWETYKALYESHPDAVDVVNYQAYAQDNPVSKDDYMKRYAELASVTGYEKLTLGIASSTGMPRGIPAQEAFYALIDLRGLGLRGAFVWALEVSQRDWNYGLEQTLLGILHA